MGFAKGDQPLAPGGRSPQRRQNILHLALQTAEVGVDQFVNILKNCLMRDDVALGLQLMQAAFAFQIQPQKLGGGHLAAGQLWETHEHIAQIGHTVGSDDADVSAAVSRQVQDFKGDTAKIQLTGVGHDDIGGGEALFHTAVIVRSIDAVMLAEAVGRGCDGGFDNMGGYPAAVKVAKVLDIACMIHMGMAAEDAFDPKIMGLQGFGKGLPVGRDKTAV